MLTTNVLVRDGDEWYSARLHGTTNFHADDGRIMIIQAELAVGGAPREAQSGIWPSFWLLGKSYRNGGDETWPMCGEIDIFENASGKDFAIPAVHYGPSFEDRQILLSTEGASFDRGKNSFNLQSRVWSICDRWFVGRWTAASATRTSLETRDLPRKNGNPVLTCSPDEYHTWAVLIDRKNSGGNWEDEKIQFLLDGDMYYEISGRDVGNEESWASVAHQAVFPIIQVAVGTNWNGGSQPNDDTATGPDVGLALKYVAVYFDS
jgi:hypothetical protein